MAATLNQKLAAYNNWYPTASILEYIDEKENRGARTWIGGTVTAADARRLVSLGQAETMWLGDARIVELTDRGYEVLAEARACFVEYVLG